MKQIENWKGKLDSFSLLIWKDALLSLLREERMFLSSQN